MPKPLGRTNWIVVCKLHVGLKHVFDCVSFLATGRVRKEIEIASAGCVDFRNPRGRCEMYPKDKIPCET